MIHSESEAEAAVRTRSAGVPPALPRISGIDAKMVASLSASIPLRASERGPNDRSVSTVVPGVFARCRTASLPDAHTARP